MMLVLDVEFVLGAYFGVHTPFDETADWPPQPDRLYSALVSTWGARGERPAEETALKWFETLPPPMIRASMHGVRTVPGAYVPPNDAAGTIEVLPARRTRQERRFPAALPHEPVITYSWETEEPDPQILASLQLLARDTAYLGRARSFVRCLFRQSSNAHDGERGVLSSRRIYAGRLAELQTAFKEGKPAAPGASVPAPESPRPSYPKSNFGTEWIVFCDASGQSPDIRRTAIAARALRSAVLKSFGSREVPEVISGHRAGDIGGPTLKPHMAIFPLANVGWRFADGRLMGLAVCLPREVSRDDEAALAGALVRMNSLCRFPDRDGSEIEVPLLDGEFWQLVRQPEPVASSLKPYRYVRAARTWSTVTPIALDRHLKSRGNAERQQEIIDQLCEACVHIGLPEPTTVIPDRNSAIRGSPHVGYSRPSRHRQSSSLRHRQPPAWENWAAASHGHRGWSTHATLIWDRPVGGPVALGAGRFFGLGLCLPID